MAALPESRRAGRPWGALRGANQELNEIATVLRAWLDDAGITVAVLHGRLTPDHFPDRAVPVQRKLYDFCAGKNLTWAFVEAVADTCTPDDAPAQQQKLKPVKQLWERACTNPTPLGGARELGEAKDRVIAAYEQIGRLQQAQAESEQARLRAEHLVTMLLAMLGQLFAKIGDLTQERNRLLARRSPDPAALTALNGRLQDAAGHREETEEALTRAQRERDEALRVADVARRVAHRLQEELDRVRAGNTGPVDPTPATVGDLDGLDPTGMPAVPDPDDLFLQDYATALRKAQSVLDTGSDALQAAEEQIAEASAVLRPDSEKAVRGTLLSRTTPDNPVTGADAAFEERYGTYLAQRHGHLTIFGVDLDQRWPLDHAYLSLEVKGSAPESVERVEQALAGRQRTVVMGSPGSGKTTLLQWLAVNAPRGTLPDLLTHLNGSVPFMLPLRSLVSHDSFPGPEEMLAAASCPLTQPEGWARRVFERGRALVLVDGVDEVASDERARAKEWLETLLAAYPRNCYVVTTRAQAVPEDWLDGVGFRHLLLRPMSADDVAGSIALWHAAARSEANGEERRELDALEETVQNAVRHDSNLTALATSPLLCSLLCALNRARRGLLPRSTMDLYRAALSMLLVRRDAERGISAVEGTQLSEDESIQLLQTLAYWLIRNGRFEADAATAVRLFSELLVAMPAVQGKGEQILRHLLTRSGLLREPAVDQLAFIHRTFQDYLGARAAVEATDFDLLRAHAHEEQWENVIKMATGHGRPRERADLLRALVARGDRDELHREQLHRLAASCLEYATQISPEVLEMIRQRVPEQR